MIPTLLLPFALLPLASAQQQSGGQCPQVWTLLSRDLTATFVGSDGQCTDFARAAIRFAFHDSSTFSTRLPTYEPASGGADGSLLLNDVEIQRAPNRPLARYRDYLLGIYNFYKPQGVGAADLIQFAGHHAVVSCPGGPTVKSVIGRRDSAQVAPDNLLPPGFGPGSDHNSILNLFVDKGFDARDIAALIGAHTCSKAFDQQANGIPVEGPQDSSPGVWNVDYYAQTYQPPQGVFRFDSDINISRPNTTIGPFFASFVNNPQQWAVAFADAFYRMSLLGVSNADGMIDCTSALPRSRVGTGRRAIIKAPQYSGNNGRRTGRGDPRQWPRSA